MGTALAIYEKVENPIAFADSMAETCSAITGCNIAQGKGVALTCLCEGLTPVEFKRRYHWIPSIGPSMRADAMRAEFRMNHGGDFVIIASNPKEASIKFIDNKGREHTSTVTWEEAQGEPWPWARDCGPGTKKSEPIPENLKDNWATPLSRTNMLIARATSRGLRLLCPELVAGIYTPEEMQDLDVVSTEISTNAPRRPSASEVIAAAAVNGSSTAEAPPFDPDANVQEAEFTAKEETSAGAESTATASTEGEAPGTITKAQVTKLNKLREELQPPQEVWDKALQSRGARTVHGLSKENAQTLIDKLGAKAKATAGTAGN